MTFGEAVRSGFDHYAKFDGRASRPAFWWWVLFVFLVGIAANIIDLAIGAPVLTALVGLALLLPNLSVSIRRLHDTDRTGWWILIYLIPLIGLIVLLVFYLQHGDREENRFGPPPGTATERQRPADRPTPPQPET
jgi:uncharacterized membrane protein YhaH (DUF805 family)